MRIILYLIIISTIQYVFCWVYEGRICINLIDSAFTLCPKYHNTEFGYNIPSYMVVGVIVCFLIISIHAIKNKVTNI